MLRIKIYTIGKIKETWLEEGIEEYQKRLKPSVIIEWHLLKTFFQLEQSLSSEASFIALDPNGKSLTSKAFSDWLQKFFIKNGSRLTFVIGGPEGLSKEIKERAQDLISFSPLTFTHQMMRLLFLEQLYRAFEIKKGTPYHK